MRAPRRLRRLLGPVLVALPIAFGIGGCETLQDLNPFAEKQAPLPGERKLVFPEGVPGVDFGAPPPQPTSANVPITAPTNSDENQSPTAEPARQADQPAPAQRPAASQTAGTPQPIRPRQAQPGQTSAAKSAKSADSDDPWQDVR